MQRFYEVQNYKKFLAKQNNHNGLTSQNKIIPIFIPLKKLLSDSNHYFCKMKELENIQPLDAGESLSVSVMGEAVPAGFPSPAQDHTESIDLNRELIPHPASTFCARVSGDSMRDCGIDNGDLLIIDKSLHPHEGCIAVCFIDGEFTLKRISIRRDGIWLIPANPDYPPLHVVEESNFQVWGIVSYVIKDMKKIR